MIVFTHGDIFTTGMPVEALVNPVNCIGVMGAGLAWAFKQRYPAAFKAYVAACRTGELRPGRVFTFVEADGHTIFHFPTKRHYRDRSRIEDIETGLVALAKEIRKHEVTSVSIPALGCGLGGLDWKDVQPCIVKAMKPLTNVRVLVFEPE
jgi:O-acetyl-ADP-ribose deacetylase (regulator of RNase III)